MQLHFPGTHQVLSKTWSSDTQQSNGGSQVTSCRTLYPLPFIDIPRSVHRFHHLVFSGLVHAGRISTEELHCVVRTCMHRINYLRGRQLVARSVLRRRQTMCPCVQMPSLLLHGADGMQLIVCISSWNPHLVHKRVVRLVSPRDLYIP